jgi:hypothetical protein
MVFQVHSAYFAPHADYQEGKQLMLWLIGLDETEEPYELRMSIGADWQSPDGGNTITHPTKRKQHINKSSIFGHWIAYCFEIPELAQTLISRGGPTDARIWIDLTLHLQLKTLSWGPNIPDQERLMPTGFMGLTSQLAPGNVPPAAPAPPVATAPPAPAPAAVPPAAPAPTDQVFDPAAALAAARAAAAPQQNGSPLFQRAVQLAQAAQDFPTFVGAALADTNILADDELALRCADDGPGGIWVIAHPS